MGEKDFMMNAPKADVETTGPGPRISLTDRVSRHPVIAGITSGLFLWSAFPPIEWSWLAWIALAPLFQLVVERGPRLRLYLGAWVGGLVFWTLSLQWVRLTDATAWVAWLAMALAFSFWWPGFLALARLAVLRLRLPLMLAAPILWVGLEHVRAHLLSGFPWYYLGHSQYRSLHLIQIADIAGALGVSFLIALVNAWIVDLLSLPLLYKSATGTRLRPKQAARLWVLGACLGGTILYGAYRLSTADFRDGPRLALIQSNIEQKYKNDADPFQIREKLRVLATRATAREPKPDLIVWPETSYPYGFVAIDPATSADTLKQQVGKISETITPEFWRDKQKDIAEDLHGMTDSLAAPMLVGSIVYNHKPDSFNKYNSAILVEPQSRTVQMYNKIHLVPFGEYIPFLERMPWLMFFTPYRNGYVPTLNFGDAYNLLNLGAYRIAVGICFEDTVPHLTRRFFSDAPGDRQPDLLVDLSNDGWFHGSAELDMHLAVSVFRTIENRVPLARAVNTGISALIDGNGRILQTLPRLTEGVLQVTVPLDGRVGMYSSLGDWLGLSCLAVCIGLAPVGAIYKRRTKPNAAPAA
ncbi:MAG: apolipoprotein N-acyltransferase [Paludisphaera borealis]|nr:apolipoprotein N-acyltransferase [Paludisphaera borealis]